MDRSVTVSQSRRLPLGTYTKRRQDMTERQGHLLGSWLLSFVVHQSREDDPMLVSEAVGTR